MKAVAVLICLVTIACAVSEGESFLKELGFDYGGEESYGLTKKPGDIWSNCGSSSDMSIIKNVTITPNPPKKKKPLTIDAVFTLKENITGGSFKAKVKYSIFPTVTRTIQVCDLAKMAGLKCPISKNTTHVVITQDVPSIPGGHYKGQVIGVGRGSVA